MTIVPRDTCPDPETLTAFVDGELSSGEHQMVLAHLADCTSCTAAVAGEREAKATLHRLGDPEPSADLLARLATVPAAVSDVPEIGRHRGGRAPAFMAAAASVVVFMVGAFAFIGASADNPGLPGATTPSGTSAIVPAADRFGLEHAATTSQAGLAGPGYSTVSYAVDAATAAAVAQ